jgi:glycosyltransferase involved in cell wall biosynthesis
MAGMKLKIAAKVDRVDEAYFNEEIKPLLAHPHVEFIGEICEAEKAEFLGNAAGLVFPIAWPEPFGLVMIEAMACGTPVIAFRNGSVPEIIEHGVTGFVVDDETDAARCARRIADLDRGRIRAEFDRRFSATRMARDYVGLYRRLGQRATFVRGEVAMPAGVVA